MKVFEWFGGVPVNPGFYSGIDENDYHAHPKSISKSGLDLINKSPAHYDQRQPFEPSPAMMMGSAIHCAILEPNRFEREYILADVKDRRQKAYKELVEQHGAERLLLPAQMDSIREIQRAASERADLQSLTLCSGHRELSAFAQDPVTGVTVRCRYDLLADAGFAVDLKKSRDVFARGFERSIAAYRYHVQVAFYSDIYHWITGEHLSEFWLIAIEDGPPYTMVPYRLDDAAIEQGRIDYRKNLNTYAECLASDSWPRYEPESELLTLPMWAFDDIDELEI